MPSVLESAYFWCEDRYYDLMDALDRSGVPVYKYFINPLESNKIPSFPVAVFSLVFLALLLFLLFGSPAQSSAVLSVSVTSGGKPLAGANVSVTIGAELGNFAITGNNGKVTFQDIPTKTALTVAASKGGVSANKTLQLRGPKTVSLELKKIGSMKEGDFLLVTVLDEEGQAVEGAKIEYYDSDLTKLGTLSSDSYGTAKIPSDGERVMVYLDVSKQGFQSQTGQGVYMSARTHTVRLIRVSEPPIINQLVSVTVNVKNAAGAGVKDATVVLYNADASREVSRAKTDSSGKASFEDAVQVGTFVFANVEFYDAALSAQYLEHRGSSDAKSAEDDPTVINVALKAKTAATGTVVITVIDNSTSLGVAGATVTFYDATSTDFFASKQSDSSGKVIFETSNNSIVHVTAMKDGYLTGVLFGVKSGQSKEIRIVPVSKAVTTSVIANVTEEGPSGDIPAENATVGLYYSFTSEPYVLSLPAKVSGADGKAFFGPVDPSVELIGKASKGPQLGYSSEFHALQNATNITIKLGVAFGNVSVTARDSFNTSKLLDAHVKAIVDGKSVSECDTKNASCKLSVQLYRGFTLVATASGYETSSKECGAGSDICSWLTRASPARDVNIYLPRPGLSAYLVEVKDSDGNRVSTVDQSGLVTGRVNRGKNYSLHFQVNVPKGIAGPGNRLLFHVRAGPSGAVSAQDYFFSGASNFNGSSSNFRGTSFTTDSLGACTSSLENVPVTAPFKFVEYERIGGAIFAGSFEIVVNLSTLKTPKQDPAAENILLEYLIAAQGNGTLRDPVDPSLPADAEADACPGSKTARTRAHYLPFSSGRTICDPEKVLGCITLDHFEFAGASYSPDNFAAFEGEQFKAFFVTDPSVSVADKKILLKIDPAPNSNATAVDLGGTETQMSFPVAFTSKVGGKFSGFVDFETLSTSASSAAFLNVTLSAPESASVKPFIANFSYTVTKPGFLLPQFHAIYDCNGAPSYSSCKTSWPRKSPPTSLS